MALTDFRFSWEYAIREKPFRFLNFYPQQDCMKTITIDLRPSWSGVLPALIMALTDGTEEGRAIAKAELVRMAALADKFVEQTRQSESDQPK